MTADEPVFTGRINREGYSIEKYFMKGEGDYVIPYLLMMPEKPGNHVVIYLHPSGKGAEASSGGEMEWFVKKGFVVLAPDLIGTGELGVGDFHGDAFIDGKSHNIWYSALLIGRSLVGIQAGDVTRLLRMLQKKNQGAEIYGVARSAMAPVLIHAAAFNPAIKRVALVESYASYRSIVMNRFYNSDFIYGTVPGSFRAFDLPDLMASLAPRKLLLYGITDSLGKPADPEAIRVDTDIIKNSYKDKNASVQLTIQMGAPIQGLEHVFSEWIK
jgi:hypothetical protein